MNNAEMKKQIRQALGTGVSHAINIAFGEIGVEGLERLGKNRDDLRASVIEVITRKARELSLSNQFADEEVRSSFGYLSGYKPKGLTEQTNRLRKLFPGFGYTNLDLLTQIEKGEIELPKNTEGWFAIPNWMKNPNIFGATYSGALQKVLDTIKQTQSGKFQNYREGQLDEQHLRQSARTQKFFRELSEAQGNPDILIVPAQFGIRHRGRSARRAREVFLQNEFGLGAFAVGIMILTHPERLMHYDDLWIDCAGDEFDDPQSGARFVLAPCFVFHDGKVKFGTDRVDRARDCYGSVSGFGPQN